MSQGELHDSPLGSGKSLASVMDRSGDSVTHVSGTEPGHARRHDPASGSAAATEVDGPREPDKAWFDDPDAHYAEVVDYMKRVHTHCQEADEFVGALKGLFPDLAEKVARARTLAAEDHCEDDVPDPDGDIAAGRSVIYMSGAEFLASLMADELLPHVRD